MKINTLLGTKKGFCRFENDEILFCYLDSPTVLSNQETGKQISVGKDWSIVFKKEGISKNFPDEIIKSIRELVFEKQDYQPVETKNENK